MFSHYTHNNVYALTRAADWYPTRRVGRALHSDGQTRSGVGSGCALGPCATTGNVGALLCLWVAVGGSCRMYIYAHTVCGHVLGCLCQYIFVFPLRFPSFLKDVKRGWAVPGGRARVVFWVQGYSMIVPRAEQWRSGAQRGSQYCTLLLQKRSGRQTRVTVGHGPCCTSTLAALCVPSL